MTVSGVTSGSSSTTTGTSAATGVNPTNVGTISFTGLGSGLNYGQIISQITAISQQQEVPYQNKVTNVTAQNTEISKIQGLLGTLQNSLNSLSNPTTFNSYSATPSDTTIISTAPQAGSTAIPGTYTINSTSLGTASSIKGTTTIGHKLSDSINGVFSDQVPLADSYAQTTPTNGNAGPGTVTVDGVKINYDVSSQSVDTILANIQSAVRSSVDATFTASYDPATDKVTFASSAKPISFGATTDTGNLLTVLKLDVGQLTNTSSSGTVTSAGGIGGVNQYENLSGNNAAGNAINANFSVPVTSGTFTINGVAITVDPTTNALSDIITKINSSGAGVTASFNTQTGGLTLVNNSVGAQSIVLGSGDTSNFLTAVGLIGGTTKLGTQTSMQYTDTTGTVQTAYSNSNTISNAIPGFALTVLGNSATGVTSTVTVSQSSTAAETSLNNFITAYNAVINEINTATAAPVVTQNGSTSHSLGGGPLYGNSIITQLKNKLVDLVSSVQTGSQSGYNSLAAIGLKLDSSFSVITANSNSGSTVSGTTNTSTGSSSSGIGLTTFQGTDGAFQALDTATFEQAFAQNPTAVQNIFVNPANFVTQIGTLLTNETGYSTILANGLAGAIPTTSVFAGLTQQNAAEITTAQNQIAMLQKQITNQANILNSEFSAASSTIASLQSQQAYLSAIGGSTTSSSTGG